MKPKVYIETSVISYLTARPSRDLVVAAHQQVTHEWWDQRRQDFDVYVSRLVLEEALAGDEGAAQRRRDAMAGLPVLGITDESEELARRFVVEGQMPEKATGDALHLGIATATQMDYLLTWNCTHIANPRMRRALVAVGALLGIECPAVCTPEELMED